MPSICLYFQVHQPFRIHEYSFFNLGKNHNYFNHKLNQEVLDKVSEKCYLPSNALFSELIKRHDIKLTFSLSGVLLEQLELYRPDVLASFQELVKTGNVEILAETYYHSLAFFYSKEEFIRQVELHKQKVQSLFVVTPKVFRNTELLYTNQLSETLVTMGYEGVIVEGTDQNLKTRSPNQLFTPPLIADFTILTRNYKLTDDVAFRFSDKKWKEFPLTPEKYVNWLTSESEDTINLFMDYETIGEHHWEDTGIFNFWKTLPELALAKGLTFKTVSQTIHSYKKKKVFDVPNTISWADAERDLSAWVGNDMQQEVVKRFYKLEHKIKSEYPELLSTWSKLSTSDHLYYISTKNYNDQSVHDYFSPFKTPYDAYIYFMNILSDLELLLRNE